MTDLKNKDLEWIIKDIYNTEKNEELDWSKYYAHLPEICDNTYSRLKNRTFNTAKFIENYFFSSEMKHKRKEYTKKLYKNLRKRGYSNKTAEFISRLTPMPVEDKYGQDFLALTIGGIGGRLHEPVENIISKYSGIDIKKIHRGTFWMEYLNNIFSGGQIALNTLVIVNGVYALITNEALSLENNLLVAAGAYAIKYAHTIIDHKHYEKTGGYRANHMMILTPLSWPAYGLSLAIIAAAKINGKEKK